MHIETFATAEGTGKSAAEKGAYLINQAIEQRGEAFVILATGASQFVLLDALIKDGGVDWTRVTLFHLDEYVGIDETHSASFVNYLKQRFLSRVAKVKEFVFIHGDTGDTDREITRVSELIAKVNIDVAFVGIGENGHLAFNDPPADFETNAPYIHVELDEKCRLQQSNEGWFESFDDVPQFAISMSVRQIMKSSAIICTVVDARKADAVSWTIEGEVSNLFPASILQEHSTAFLFLDAAATAKLSKSGIQ